MSDINFALTIFSDHTQNIFNIYENFDFYRKLNLELEFTLYRTITSWQLIVGTGNRN